MADGNDPFGLASRLASLEATAAQLNRASDSINGIINAVEKQLSAANVGLEVWLRPPLTQTDAQGFTGLERETVWTEDRLGYAKVNGKWCIAVKDVRVHTGRFEGDTSCPYTNECVDGMPIPLTQASRETRIAALDRLPDLIEALEAQA